MAKEERVSNWIVFTNNSAAEAPVFDESDYPIKLDRTARYHRQVEIDFHNKNYRKEYKEGIQVYIVKDCLDPRGHLTQKNLALTLSENHLKQFPMFSKNRVEMWEDMRNVTRHIVFMILNAPFLALNREFEKDKQWGVIDLTRQTICDNCFTVVNDEDVVYIGKNSIYSNLEGLCPDCYKKLQKDTNAKGQDPEYVYFFLEYPDGAVKIGKHKGKDVEDRRKELQIGNSKQLIILHKIPSNDVRATELAFHKHFKSRMIKRGNKKKSEWFNLTDEDIDWIKEGKYTKAIQRTMDAAFHVVTDVEEYYQRQKRELVDDLLSNYPNMNNFKEHA